jgi:hypothetical protein
VVSTYFWGVKSEFLQKSARLLQKMPCWTGPYAATGDPDKPLAKMKKADRDKAWVSICEEIKKAVSRW